MDNTTLRHVLLRGPLLANGQPLWELAAAAPDASLPGKAYQPEDDTHPLRALLIDAGGLEGQGGLRHPQLLSLHLIAGHGSGKYRTRFDAERVQFDPLATLRDYPDHFAPLPKDDGKKRYSVDCREALRINLPDDKGEVLSQLLPCRRRWTFTPSGSGKEQTTPAYFISGALPAAGETAAQPAAAAFQHVLVEPCPDLGQPWPGKVDKAIEVPAFALVAGRIELAVAYGACPWLGALQPQPPAAAKPKEIQRYALVLTPEGIELDCQVDFPGQSAPLDGRFLLSVDDRRLVLTLQPEHLRDPQRRQWQEAWAAVLPQGREEEALHGMRLSGEAGQIPAFRYGLSIIGLPATHPNRPGLLIDSKTRYLPVEIPARHLRLNLLSPADEQRVDGVVECTGGHFVLGSSRALGNQAERYFGSQALYRAFSAGLGSEPGLILAWASPRPRNAGEEVVTPYLKLESSASTVSTPAALHVDLQTSAGKPYAVTLDERRLADTLRRAYGLPALVAGQPDPARPWLPGFIPLSDGWLQLPLANLPPLNPALDSELLEDRPVATANALDGFLRFLPRDDLPQVQSAFAPPATAGLPIRQTPWSVTLEGAGRLRVALGLVPGRAATGATLKRGQAVVDQPDLSTRGLLWLSSDRPDASEAIPRLGAGPGAFIDIALERSEQERTVLSMAIEQLSLLSTQQGQQATVTRQSLALTIDLEGDGTAAGDGSRPKVYYWSRHPHMPLAAQMPMTRMLAASVRPLESRDLLPFEMRHADAPEQRMAALGWSHEKVFAELQGNWRYRVAAHWPLPPDPQAPNSLEPPDRGIGLVAFGVPGAELKPTLNSWQTRRWDELQAALRFDLPVLDEAFATAALPRSAEEPDAAQAARQADTAPVATALDWSVLEQFWGEQERRLQLARVAHSYMVGYRPLGTFDKVAVDALVGGLRWNTANIGFDLDAAQPLPYGWMQLGSTTRLSGNQALRGLSATFSVSATELEIGATPSAQSVQVLGNSPSAYLRGTYLVDARGVGAQPLDPRHGWWRPLSGLHPDDAKVAGRFSSPQMFAVHAHDDPGLELLRFWFKDLPLTRDGRFEHSPGVDTFAWQDGHLLKGGFEWRLLPATGTATTFASGSERIALGDLFIEPLRLLALQVPFNGGAPSAALPDSLTILARLSIGDEREDVDDGGDLVKLVFAASAGHLALQAVLPVQASVRLPVMVGTRLVMLEARTLELAGDRLRLLDPALSFDFAGYPLTLACARQNPGAVFTWRGEPAQSGQLSITAARLQIGLREQGRQTHLRIAHALVIDPGKVDQGTPALRVRASGGLEDSRHEGTLKLLDSLVPVHVELTRGALSLTSDSPARALLKGFPASGRLRFGLLASLAAFAAGTQAVLQSARFRGDLDQLAYPGAAPRCRCLLDRVLIEGGGTPGAWHGELSLYGKLAGCSVIGWPRVTAPSPDDEKIPFPESAPNGRRTLRIESGPVHAHQVEWLLDGHRMALETAHAINHADPLNGVWTATVMALHTLVQEDGEAFRFTAVDGIVLGTLGALIPPWPGGADPFKEERLARSTFAARYRDGNPGMLWPGRGGLGSVLHGAQGQAFRQAIYAAGEQAGNVVVSGGFVGLIEDLAHDRVPLLRLPTLMGLSPGYLGEGEEPLLLQHEPAGPIDLDVAWPDSLAALKVAPTFACATSPASATDADLQAAVRIGSRPLHGDPEARGRLVGALLVEQAFATNFIAQTLERTPYFFASAAALSRVLQARAKATAIAAARVLSVVAQVHLDPLGGPAQRRAAALLTSGDWAGTPTRSNDGLPGEDRGELLVAGDTVLAQPWPGLEFARQAEDGFDAQVAMKAYALHTRPRAALLCDRSGALRSVVLPQPTLQPRSRPLLSRDFADAGRGYQLPVHSGLEMAGVEEGFSAALRDDRQDGSGIAALSRRVDLPALAAAPDAARAVWLAQQRAPLYLPIRSRFASEPIPWLVPAAPRSRVPVAGVLEAHLEALGGEQGAEHWQPLLTGQAMLAAISERPGILMARHLRLEIGAEQQGAAVGGFDPAFPRFGAPAQASAALPRVERTPRPGPLPANSGYSAFDRRPCASPLLPGLNHRALIGPADSLCGRARRGDGSLFDWSVTLVAAPETSGTITSSWDGTLRLIAEIDERPVLDGDDKVPPASAVPESWAGELLELLFGPQALPAKPPYTVQASASLEIDGHSLAFRSLQVSPRQAPQPQPERLQRGYVSIVLDMRESAPTNQVPGPVRVAIAERLANAAGNPAVQLRLMVQPSAEVVGGKRSQGNFVLARDEQVLPSGTANPPLELRFALWPLLRGRGALALEPCSLLFCDPAYDAGLSAPPHQVSRRAEQDLYLFAADRQRVNRQGAVTLMAWTRSGQGTDASLNLTLRALPRSGQPRDLRLAGAAEGKPAMLLRERVHQLALGRLLELDGRPADLAAGDLLELAASFAGGPLSMTLIVTDEPVAEPPPGLYAALTRTPRDTGIELSLPLYAQSPLPWRVDLLDAAAGFRAGLLRRSAKFVWTLARPADETGERGVYIVKVDRNGQSWLPEKEDEFIKAQSIVELWEDARGVTDGQRPPGESDW